MRKQMIENAAFDVATQVRAVEDCIESALAEMAELQGRMIRARAVTRVGIATGHEAFAELAAALSGLVAARGSVARCHAELKDAKAFVPGLRETSFGDGDECPPPKSLVDLRVVA